MSEKARSTIRDLLSGIDRLIAITGNSYDACIVLAELTRIFSKLFNNVLLDSEIQAWIIRGDSKELLDKLEKLSTRKRFETNEFDILNYIEDTYVTKNVKNSVRLSIQYHHLIYCYQDVDDPNKKSRIRVLTNIIWYEYYKPNS